MSAFFPKKQHFFGKLGIPNLARMFLMKSYSMLQNSRVTAFTVSKLLRENQQDGGWGGDKITPTTTTTTTQTRIKGSFCSQNSFFIFWLFSAYRKNDDLGDKIYFKILWRYNLVNKQLQCTYSPIFQEVKATMQWNLANRI